MNINAGVVLRRIVFLGRKPSGKTLGGTPLGRYCFESIATES